MSAFVTDAAITSASNPRIKSLVALRRRRQRQESGVSLLEGFEELTLALGAGVLPRTLYFCPELMHDPIEQKPLVEQLAAQGVEVVRLGRAAFEKAAYRQGPDGFLAVAATPGVNLAEIDLPPRSLTLLAQGVEKPGNLGAMLRTADAAGVHAVIAADPVTDWGNPNVVRSSKGTVYSLPVAMSTTSEYLEWIAASGITLVATTPDTDSLHTDVDLTGPVAIAVGAEKTGLTDDLLEAADVRVRIPMAGQANSLNVATSAAIVLYEAVRQRGLRG